MAECRGFLFFRLSTSRFRMIVEKLHQFVTFCLFSGQSDTLSSIGNCSWWISSAVKVLSLLSNFDFDTSMLICFLMTNSGLDIVLKILAILFSNSDLSELS